MCCNSVFHYAHLIACICAVTSSISAQADSVRDLNSALNRYDTGAEVGLLAVAAKSNQLKWTILDPIPSSATGLEDSVCTLPLDRIGGIQHLGARAFLISGANKQTSSGWILRVHLENNPIAILIDKQQDYGTAFDPLAAVYNAADARIYVYDEVGKRILAAPWQGGTAALPPAAGFTVIFDSTSLPLLQAGDMRLFVKAGENGVRVKEWGTAPVPYTRVYLDASTWKSEVVNAALAAPSAAWQVKGSTFVNARGTIELKGPAAVADLVELATGSVLYNFSNPGGDVWTTVPVDMGLIIPGYAYCFKGGAALDSRPFRPLLRWGNPQKQGALVAARGIVAASAATIGNQDFAVSSHVRLEPPPQSTTSVSADVYLYVAAYVEGDNQVQQVGDLAVLEPDNILGPLNLTLTDQDWFATTPFAQAIPNTPDLVNTVILWQFVSCSVNEGCAVSDVFGTTILDPNCVVQSQQWARNGKGGTTRPTVNENNLAAAWKWLGATKQGQLPASKRSMYNLIRKELRRKRK